MDTSKVEQIKELLMRSQRVLVILGPDCKEDMCAVAVSIQAGLKGMSKAVGFHSPMPETYARWLPSGCELTNDIGNKDLTISFPYQAESVEKVSYHIDETDQRFCLVIKPQPGMKPLASHEVEFYYSGAEADLIFVIGAPSLESLEQLYIGYESLFVDTTVISINTFEPDYGHIKLDISGTSCASEATVSLLQAWEMAVQSDMSTQLLANIDAATNHFSSFTASAETFESVAWLLRQGARRKTNQNVATQNHSQMSGSGSVSHFASALTKPIPTEKAIKKKAKNGVKSGDLHYVPTELGLSGK